MVESGRSKTSALQRLKRWPTTSPSSSTTHRLESKKNNVAMESNFFQPIDHENLVQGMLYIMKVKIVTIGLFEGWNDDMCCFSILRSDTKSMRWSEARYLPGDFYAFDAFDDAGNPPVYLWTRFLHIQIPVNWFSLFEEARRRQRMWNMDLHQQYLYQQQQQQQEQEQQEDDYDTTSFPPPPSSVSSLPLDGNNAVYSVAGYERPDLGTPFSDVRHGSPTIYSDTFANHFTSNCHSTSDGNSLNQSNRDDRCMVYSPTPSIQYPGTRRAPASCFESSSATTPSLSHHPLEDEKRDNPLSYLQPRDKTMIYQ